MRRLSPAFEVKDFRRWFRAAFGMTTALQMLEVIIGWQVYSHQHSALDLGWIGLAEFVPLFVLAIPAGHIADRLPRKLVLAGANVDRARRRRAAVGRLSDGAPPRRA
jgi:MFS family permease